MPKYSYLNWTKKVEQAGYRSGSIDDEIETQLFKKDAYHGTKQFKFGDVDVYSHGDLFRLKGGGGLLDNRSGSIFYFTEDQLRASLRDFEIGYGGDIEHQGYDLGRGSFEDAFKLIGYDPYEAADEQYSTRRATERTANESSYVATERAIQAEALDGGRDAQAYNATIRSAFNTINQILQFGAESAAQPSTIQTLYLDNQAKTYLPSSVRDRGIAGVLGGS